MFHRVDDPDRLDAARYFQLAELLPVYDGACRAAALRELRAAEPDDPYVQAMTGAPTPGAPVAHPAAFQHDPTAPLASSNDIASLARMSQQPGFPGIEYQGG